VAKHLSETYGDRAFSVAKLAALTGKRWPIVGKRLHEEFPYIDAEVSSNEFLTIIYGNFKKSCLTFFRFDTL
jgi:hypothetical protein